MPPGGSNPPPVVNIAPHVVARLGNGSTWLDVPLMTLYSAPKLNVKGFATSVNLTWTSYSGEPSANITFQWGNVTGSSLPVHFVLDKAPYVYFLQGPADGFTYLPAGLCVTSCISWSETTSTRNVGEQGVNAVLWRMNYTLLKMAATVDSVNETWIQVNYSFRPLLEIIGEPLPFANVTAPTSADLVAVGMPVTLDYSKGSAWQYNASVHDFPMPPAAFHNSLPAIVIHAGNLNLTAVLSSQFGWGPPDDNWIGLSGTDGANVTLQFYMDARFGALLVQYVP